MPPPYERQIFVCTNRRPEGAPRPSCGPRGGEAVRAAFKKLLAAKGINDVARASHSGCHDACEHGVSVVVYPEGVWYGGVTVDDVEEIVEKHVMGGVPVERLRIQLPEKTRRLPPILA